MGLSVKTDRQPSRYDRYIVVRVSARVEVNLHALIDAGTQRTIMLYRSRQLAIRDAAVLNHRYATPTGNTACPLPPATARTSSKPSRRQSIITSASGTAPVSTLMPTQQVPQ